MGFLRNNARSRLTTISRRTHIPVTTIYDTVRRYEKKFILKHACLIDFKKLGYTTKANVVIKAGENKRLLLEFLKNATNVNSIFRLNDAYDFMVEVIFKEPEEVDDFVNHLKSKFDVQESMVFGIADDLKREDFLATDE